jgi:hypothetical protein
MRTLRDKLTYANVISTLCLFMLLGGGAYAAVKLPKNSVGTKQIKNNAITGKKIKKGTIGADKLTSAAVATLKGTKGDPGPAGAQGPQGTTNSGAYATVEAGTEPGFVGDHPGFAAVEKVQEGIACLTPAAGTNIAHPVASVDLGNSGAEDNGKLVEPFSNGIVKECDPGQLEVWTFELFGEPLNQERSNSVAFTVFVPTP